MRMAVSLASMSARFCSIGPPFIPDPTMLRKERTRVSRGVDDVGLELAEVAPARATHVHQRRLAAAERVAVRRHGREAVAEVRVRLGAKKHVRVQVDQPGHDVQAGGVDDPAGLCRVDRRGDLGNLAVGDGHVHDRRRAPFFGSMTWPPLMTMA